MSRPARDPNGPSPQVFRDPRLPQRRSLGGGKRRRHPCPGRIEQPWPRDYRLPWNHVRVRARARARAHAPTGLALVSARLGSRRPETPHGGVARAPRPAAAGASQSSRPLVDNTCESQDLPNSFHYALFFWFLYDACARFVTWYPIELHSLRYISQYPDYISSDQLYRGTFPNRISAPGMPTARKQCGAEEARRAHNPEVSRSKRLIASQVSFLSFFLFLSLCFSFLWSLLVAAGLTFCSGESDACSSMG